VPQWEEVGVEGPLDVAEVVEVHAGVAQVEGLVDTATPVFVRAAISDDD
jgi:hypothetical protein